MIVLYAAPLAFGFAHWRFEPGQDSLVLSVKGTYRLAHDGRAQPLDEPEGITGDVFTGEEPELGACRYASDVVPFKPRADALLVGKAYAPGGTATTQCTASFSVGAASLALRVTGDRYWLDETRASEPKSFTEMDLGYERAFGGPGWAANPVGKGVFGAAAREAIQRPLPNVEDPREPAKSMADRPAAAGFGPLAPHWAHRMSKWPAVTTDWIENGWPWAPAGLDYSHFNAAQPALQIEGYLKGDETLTCENLHPKHKKYRCELPRVRARCFVLDKQGDQERFREVSLRLDTLWADMSEEKLVLVWRGRVPVRAAEFEEVEYVYVAAEPLDGPLKPIEEHRAAFELQRSEVEGAKRSPDPLVAGANDNEAAAAPAPAPPPAPPPLPKPMPPLPAGIRAQLEKLGLSAAMIAAVERGDEAALVADLGQKTGKQGADLDKLMAESFTRVKKTHVDAGGDPSIFDEPAPKAASAPAAPAQAAAASGPWTRERVEATLAAGGSPTGADLSKLDLTGLDLRERDLSGCLLKGAKLDGAQLGKAKLDGANLSGAQAKAVSFREATLSDADLTGLVAPGADFTGASLAGALLDGAMLGGAKLEGCKAAGASLSRADLSDANLTGADLTGARFPGATLDRALFTGAKLDGAIAEGAKGEKVDFRGASLVGFRASEGSVLPGAKLAGCKADRSRWMGADLTGADLSRASLAGADLSRSNLSDARMIGADCNGADFTKANLPGANLAGANLAAAKLDSADLRKANLRDANLYQAALWQAQPAGAELDGAFTAGTLLQSPVRNWAR